MGRKPVCVGVKASPADMIVLVCSHLGGSKRFFRMSGDAEVPDPLVNLLLPRKKSAVQSG